MKHEQGLIFLRVWWRYGCELFGSGSLAGPLSPMCFQCRPCCDRRRGSSPVKGHNLSSSFAFVQTAET